MPHFHTTPKPIPSEHRTQPTQPSGHRYSDNRVHPIHSKIRDRSIPALNLAHIKQMSPNTPLSDVHKELQEDLVRLGKRALQQQIKAEHRALQSLRKQKERISFEIDEQCLAPVVKQCLDHGGISHSFWSKSQSRLKDIISPENLHQLEQQIDWLATRQSFFKEIDKSASLLHEKAQERAHSFGSCLTK